MPDERPKPPECTKESPAPRVEPWDTGGIRSDDGWNRKFAHLTASTLPEDVNGINWGCSCPACGTTFRTTFGTSEDAVFPDAKHQ